MAYSVDPDQTAPIGAVRSGSTLFATILNSSVMLGNYLQQTSSADDIFRFIFFLALKGIKERLSEAFLFFALVGTIKIGYKYTLSMIMYLELNLN